MNPIVATVDAVVAESSVLSADAGQALSRHVRSRSPLRSIARIPNTVPTPSPTTPTPSAAYAGTRFGTSRGSSVVGIGAGFSGVDTTAGEGAVMGAWVLGALGSGSRVSATESVAPSLRWTFCDVARYPGAVASTTWSPGSIGRFMFRF